jgi:hypothetical protein
MNCGLGLRGGAAFARVMDFMPQHTGSALAGGIGLIGTPLVGLFLSLGALSLGAVVAVQVYVSLAVPLLAVRPKAKTAVI